MVAARSLESVAPPSEQRLLLHGVSWKDYVLLRDILDGPHPRMTYCQGELELMSPSPEHEGWKKNGARFIELFAHVKGLDLWALGSTTFKHELAARGVEPDECYSIGKEITGYPQIVLEVVHTSPLLDKLETYRLMGVSEVWVYRDGAFTLHVLDAEAKRYQLQPRSALMPGLDFELLARLVVRKDVPQALREFESVIRGG